MPLASLIDAKRQWFKSCIGLDARETRWSPARPQLFEYNRSNRRGYEVEYSCGIVEYDAITHHTDATTTMP